MAELLFTRDAEPNAADQTGGTPLYWASHQGHAVLVELLLQRGANADAVTRKGAAPLHRAASFGHAAVAELLVEHGASVSVADCNSWTALHYAAQQGHVHVALLLLKHSAQPDTTADKVRAAQSTRNRRYSYVRFQGRSLTRRLCLRAQGRTALHVAAVRLHIFSKTNTHH